MFNDNSLFFHDYCLVYPNGEVCISILVRYPQSAVVNGHGGDYLSQSKI